MEIFPCSRLSCSRAPTEGTLVEESVSLADLAFVVRRSAAWVVGLVLLGALAGFAVSVGRPRLHVAEGAVECVAGEIPKTSIVLGDALAELPSPAVLAGSFALQATSGSLAAFLGT